MATCPECEFDEIDTTDHEEGDELSCPECGKMTRIGHRIDGGRKVRICRKCEGVVDK